MNVFPEVLGRGDGQALEFFVCLSVLFLAMEPPNNGDILGADVFYGDVFHCRIIYIFYLRILCTVCSIWSVFIGSSTLVFPSLFYVADSLAAQLTSDPGPEEMYSSLLRLIATSSLHGQLRTRVKGRGVEWEILAVDFLHTQGIDVSLSTDVLTSLLTPYFVTV